MLRVSSSQKRRWFKRIALSITGTGFVALAVFGIGTFSARADDGGGGHQWFDAFFSEALHSPLPATVNKSPGIIPATIPPDDSYPDPSGSMGIHINSLDTTVTA